MADKSKITLYHVGGRWGNRAFPTLPCFEPDFIDVIFEADKNAIEGIHKAREKSRSKLIVCTIFLAEKNGTKTNDPVMRKRYWTVLDQDSLRNYLKNS